MCRCPRKAPFQSSRLMSGPEWQRLHLLLWGLHELRWDTPHKVEVRSHVKERERKSEEEGFEAARPSTPSPISCLLPYLLQINALLCVFSLYPSSLWMHSNWNISKPTFSSAHNVRFASPYCRELFNWWLTCAMWNTRRKTAMWLNFLIKSWNTKLVFVLL